MQTANVVKRRRIAVAMEYPLMQQGGTEVLVQELVRRLVAHYEIVLVSGDKSFKELPEEFSRLIAAHLPSDLETGGSSSGRALVDGLRESKVELAHFHLGGTFVWQSNRVWRCPIFHLAGGGVPCIATNHLASEWLSCGVNPNRPLWQKHLFQVFALLSRSLVLRRLRLEVCVSKHDQTRLTRMFRLFRGKITQRYHSLLPADAPPPDLEHRDRTILCVGTVGGRKAQPILAEAFARIAKRHPDWQLDFVGRVAVPADAERVLACATSNGISERVHLLGRLGDEETLTRVKRASIFALPSLQEGLGLSLQEALFHGCVGVGSRAGGIPELIDHEVNGLLVPAGDIGALSAALDRLMSEPSLLARFRSQSRPSILRKGMTAQAMTQAYLELYEKYLPRK